MLQDEQLGVHQLSCVQFEHPINHGGRKCSCNVYEYWEESECELPKTNRKLTLLEPRKLWTVGPTELKSRAITLRNMCNYPLNLHNEIGFVSWFNFLGNTKEHISYYFTFQRSYRKIDPVLSSKEKCVVSQICLMIESFCCVCSKSTI